MAGDCCAFEFFRRRVDGKQLNAFSNSSGVAWTDPDFTYAVFVHHVLGMSAYWRKEQFVMARFCDLI